MLGPASERGAVLFARTLLLIGRHTTRRLANAPHTHTFTLSHFHTRTPRRAYLPSRMHTRVRRTSPRTHTRHTPAHGTHATPRRARSSRTAEGSRRSRSRRAAGATRRARTAAAARAARRTRPAARCTAAWRARSRRPRRRPRRAPPRATDRRECIPRRARGRERAVFGVIHVVYIYIYIYIYLYIYIYIYIYIIQLYMHTHIYTYTEAARR